MIQCILNHIDTWIFVDSKKNTMLFYSKGCFLTNLILKT